MESTFPKLLGKDGGIFLSLVLITLIMSQKKVIFEVVLTSLDPFLHGWESPSDVLKLDAFQMGLNSDFNC